MNKEQAKQRLLEIKEEKKKIKAEIKELKEVINKPEWSPIEGAYFIEYDGEVDREIDGNYELLEIQCNFGSYYKTKEQAEKRALQLKFQNWMFHLAEDLNEGWVPDWSAGHTYKWVIYYKDTKWLIEYYNTIVGPERTYFKDKETALKAIEKVKTWKWAKELLK